MEKEFRIHGHTLEEVRDLCKCWMTATDGQKD